MRRAHWLTIWTAFLALAFPALALGQATRFEVKVPTNTPADQTLYIAGSVAQLGNWRPDGLKLIRQEDGLYVVEVDLPAGEAVEFKITRGTWETVEKAADGTELGNRSVNPGETAKVEVASWADIPAPGPGAAPVPMQESVKPTVTGQLRIHENFESKELGNKRTLRVWLPPGYDEDEQTRYPVLYMQDGQNLFDRVTAFLNNEWEADETATRLINQGRIRPLIIVGIDHAGDQRMVEYSPKIGEGGAVSRGDAYLRFVITEVKPFIDDTYRTMPNRPDTFIGGSSMGGLITLEALRTQARTFGGAIVMSPSLHWNGARLQDVMENAAMPVWKDVKLFLSVGEAEGARAAEEVARVRSLNEKLRQSLSPVNLQLVVVSDGQHNEQAWGALLPEALTLLLGIEENSP